MSQLLSPEDVTAYERHIQQQLIVYGVPEHLHGGLIRYIVHLISPGHFLTAVLENNLKEAFARADETSREGLFALVTFLYNVAPLDTWGSPERVEAWLNRRKNQADAV